MIGIIGAMDIEVAGIRAAMRDTEVTRISGIDFCTGTLGRHRVVLARCGIGKVFAAICAEAMILNFSPEVIINTGVAGSLSPELNVTDIAVATAVVQHDMDTSAIGDPPGLISGINMTEFPADPEWSDRLASSVADLGIKCVRGVIASGDIFVADRGHKERIIDTFGAVACEMEGAAIGHVCYVNGVPFAVLRSISDSFAGQAGMEYAAFAEVAAANSCKVLVGVI